MTAGMIPSFTSENAKTVRREAMSDVRTGDEAGAAAERVALDAATTGAGQASIASSIRASAFASATFSSWSRSTAARFHSTSAPAQKLGPSPASTTARASPTSANASVSSAMSSASKAFRVSGRASVIRRTSPSLSTRNAPTRGSLESTMLHGALAAAVTPLRENGAALDEGAFVPARRALRRRRPRRRARSRHGRGGNPPLRRRAPGGCESLPAGGRESAAGRRALRRADDGRNGGPRAPRGRGRCRRGRRHRPAVLPARRGAQLAHFLAAATGERAAALLRLRVRRTTGYAVAPSVLERLRDEAPNVAA